MSININDCEVRIQWATPDIDKNIMYMARVSNPGAQNSEKVRLLYYCMEEGHVSPFEMASVCMEINVPRDIGRQMIRHKSMPLQEFSQRYQTVDKLGDWIHREFRLQDTENRQASIEVSEDDERHITWKQYQEKVLAHAQEAYNWCIKNEGAKEVARVVLPEGLTMSRMYFNGTMRSWIHYLKQRLDPSTQKEHRIIAEKILHALKNIAPITMDAFFHDNL